MKYCDFDMRYRRHLMLPEVGADGQQRLLQSRVAIIGAGGLGSPVALYLAAAGVGHINIVDGDHVDISNLQRQIIHNSNDIGCLKTESAKEKIHNLNPDVEVTTFPTLFNSDNANTILNGCDVAIDCTDNATSRFLINDTCVSINLPLVHGAINSFSGNVMTIIPGCANLRDLFPTPPQSPAPSHNYGVLGVIAGIIGTIQAAEALKILLGIGELLTNQVLTFDALTMSFTKFKINTGKFR